MFRLAAVAALVSLSACAPPVATPYVPPEPDPAEAAALQACQGGDMEACTAVAAIRAQRADEAAQYRAYEAQRAAALSRALEIEPITVPVLPSQAAVTCEPTFGGGVTCR